MEGRLQSATGCDRLYVGRSMEDAHRGMGLSAKDWDRTVDFLRATMTEFKVAPQLQNEVVTLFLIVNLSSSSVASVAGMDRQALTRDPDFVRAVQSIVEDCRVNVDIAKVRC